MQRFLLAALLLACGAADAQVFQRQWGVATTIDFSLGDYDSPFDLATNSDVTFASGDVKYSCDEGAQANVDADAGAGTEALPTEEGGAQFAQALTAIQMRCARIYLAYIDSATKVWMDSHIVIETYGCHSAQDPRGVLRCGTAQDGDTQSITLDASASSTTNAYYRMTVRIIAGTGANQGDRTITQYNGTSKVADVDTAWLTNPDSTSVFQIFAERNSILAADTNGVVQSNVVQISDDSAAATNAEADYDGTGYSKTNSNIGTVLALDEDAVAQVWAATCEENGAYTAQDCLKLLFAEALGACEASADGLTWACEDPTGTEDRFTITYPEVGVDGDRNPPTLTP